jgi:hypothetical protein
VIQNAVLQEAKHVQDPDEINEARSVADLGEGADMLEGIGSEKDSICVASGRVIKRQADGTCQQPTLQCRICRHHVLVCELGPIDSTSRVQKPLAHCPLCHSQLLTR